MKEITIFVPITYKHPAMDKDINRIKVILVEKRELINGWLSNLFTNYRIKMVY